MVLLLTQGGELHEEGPDFELTGESGKLPAWRTGRSNGKLYIDCISVRDQGIYTCVATTPENRIVTKTKLVLGLYYRK